MSVLRLCADSVLNGCFRQLVRDVKPRGVKEKIAVFLLKHEWIRMYHELCRLVYRKR